MTIELEDDHSMYHIVHRDMHADEQFLQMTVGLDFNRANLQC